MELDEDPEIEEALVSAVHFITQRHELPIVFVNGEFVGNAQEVVDRANDGTLQHLLEATGMCSMQKAKK